MREILSNIKKYYVDIILFVAVIILALLSAFALQQCKDNHVENPSAHTVFTDTIIQIDTVYIQNTKITTKLKIVYDTTQLPSIVYPFVARKDTIDAVTKDTISFAYSYPVNIFLYDIRRSPIIRQDKIVRQFDTIKIQMPYIKKGKFEQYMEYLGFAASGFVAAYIFKGD